MVLEYTILTLVIILAVAGLIGLFVKAQTQWNRYWVGYLTLTLLMAAGATWVVFSAPPDTLAIAVIPIFIFGILLAIFFGYKLSSTGPHHPTGAAPGEPLYTQEELKGRAGTYEALRIYFLVLTVGFALIALLVYFFSMTNY